MQLHIMPANVNSFSENGYLGVKYRHTKYEGLKAYKKQGVTIVELPDRTLYCGRGNSSVLGILAGVEPDVMVPTCMLGSPKILKEAGYEYMMVNPWSTARTSACRRNKYVKIVSDSGGFQLANGVEEFIDLDTLADFYRHRVDYGIGLDVPLPLPLHYTPWLTRMALVTAKNNKYLVNALRGSPAKIYDVSHGLTLDARKRFLDVVMRNQTSEYLAIGGIGQAQYDTANTSLVTAVLNLCYVFSAGRTAFKRFHVLGTTSPAFLSLYYILLKTGVVDYITADSSTYSQAAIAFHMWFPFFTNDTKFPQMYELPKERYSWRLACNCPICSLVGYGIGYRAVGELNMWHSLYTRSHMHFLVEEQVDDLLSGHLTPEQLAARLTTKSNALTTKPLLVQLIYFCLEMRKGFKHAYSKYIDKLNYHVRKKNSTLFDGEGAANPKVVKIVTSAVMRYEKIHGIKA